MIFEVVITTVDLKKNPHIAPMGITKKNDLIVLKPFKPSLSLDNILNSKTAVLNVIDDVRVFAGCVTGRKKFNLKPLELNIGFRLEHSVSYSLLSLIKFIDDDSRPQLIMKEEKTWQNNTFAGLNRAQAAVIEGAILVSRLNILPLEKIMSEMNYLNIAIAKTAGPIEEEAWSWLEEAVKKHKQKNV